MRSEEADIRLLERKPVSYLFLKEGLNHFCSFEPITYRHVDVHQDQLISSASLIEPPLHHIEGLLAIRGIVTLHLILLEEVHHSK